MNPVTSPTKSPTTRYDENGSVVDPSGTSTPRTGSSTSSASPKDGSQGGFVSASSLAESPDGHNLSMKVNLFKSTSLNDPIELLSSDDEDGGFDTKSSPAFSHAKQSNRNLIFVYRFATPYILAIFFARNGPHSTEKVYDREFHNKLEESLVQREIDKAGFDNMSYFCNLLGVHSSCVMRLEGPGNNTKKTKYSNGGTGVHHCYLKVLTRKEVLSGMGTDKAVTEWMEVIRKAYLDTPTQFPQYKLHLEHGGILGRAAARTRSLDRVLLDADVADFAKLIYRTQWENGTLINDKRKVSKFFSESNMAAANDLLG